MQQHEDHQKSSAKRRREVTTEAEFDYVGLIPYNNPAYQRGMSSQSLVAK